ncbi:hypothetical protein OA067_01675 [Gammaproteobacteria bacterium]|nr:hypothetical protein [Gammaproteobacteria bacterium]
MALKDFLDEAKNKLGRAGIDENLISKNIVEKVSSVLDEGQDMASEKIFALIEDFNQSLPVLSKAGYELEELELELGIPPKLIPHFKYDEEKDSDVESLLNELQGNGLGINLMKALITAGRFQRKIKFKEMQFSHVEIELSVIPSVRLSYKSKDGSH